MKKYYFGLLMIALLTFSLNAKTDENHDSHAEDEHEHTEGEKHSEDESHDHEEEDGHGHGEENSQIGPGKGIVSASEKDGFQISPEAEKNFEIKKTVVSNVSQIELPKSAVVTAGMEVNLYRSRQGHYKRVDFVYISRNANKIIVTSKDLKSGDEIVVQGMGLLRIAEIAAFGGAPEGHSH